MSIKVVKFGGSSLADAEHFRQVAAIVKADPDRRFVVRVGHINGGSVAHVKPRGHASLDKVVDNIVKPSKIVNSLFLFGFLPA